MNTIKSSLTMAWLPSCFQIYIFKTDFLNHAKLSAKLWSRQVSICRINFHLPCFLFSFFFFYHSFLYKFHFISPFNLHSYKSVIFHRKVFIMPGTYMLNKCTNRNCQQITVLCLLNLNRIYVSMSGNVHICGVLSTINSL